MIMKMFDSKVEKIEENRVLRYQISQDGRLLTYENVIDYWQTDPVFSQYLSSLLADAPFEGFRWETPPITTKTVGRAFEFVLVNASGFMKRRTDRSAFREYLTNTDEKDGIVSFKNLGGDAALVVPSPQTNEDVYGHFASFVRGAPETQVQSLWCELGRTVSSRLSDVPIWVSTAGGGVAWLHVRIDSRPKYYHYSEYKSV